MHELTRKNLDLLARWTREIVEADSVLKALSAELPERREDDEIYFGLDSWVDNIVLDIYQAAGVDDAAPFLAAVRRAGFRREGEAQELPDANQVRWDYRIEIVPGYNLPLRVYLHLKTNSTSGESARCRYVEVGKKEVPDMKLLCGDELAAWEAEHAE